MKVFKLICCVQNEQGHSSPTKQKDEQLRANTVSPLHPDQWVKSGQNLQQTVVEISLSRERNSRMVCRRIDTESWDSHRPLPLGLGK